MSDGENTYGYSLFLSSFIHDTSKTKTKANSSSSTRVTAPIARLRAKFPGYESHRNQLARQGNKDRRFDFSIRFHPFGIRLRH